MEVINNETEGNCLIFSGNNGSRKEMNIIENQATKSDNANAITTIKKQQKEMNSGKTKLERKTYRTKYAKQLMMMSS